MTWKITSDSTCDLSPELLDRENISILPLHINLDGVNHRDQVDLFPDDIFSKVDAGGSLPVTAAINPAEYTAFFAEFAQEYDFVVHLCLSAEFSSCYQNACLAAEAFPNVYVVDSRNLSTGHGHMVLTACDLARQGLTGPEIVDALAELAPRVDASFILSRLDYLRKGGRCSALAAMGANVLKLRPSILVKDGRMTVGKKYRGSFEKTMCEYIRDRLEGRNDLDLSRIFITHSGLDEETIALAEHTVRSLQDFREVYITRAGCTISCHCGPNSMGVLFIHKKEEQPAD